MKTWAFSISQIDSPFFLWQLGKCITDKFIYLHAILNNNIWSFHDWVRSLNQEKG